MKIKSEKDFWSGLMFIAVGRGLCLGFAHRIQLRFSSARPGPAYFPFGLGVVMAVLGAMVLFKALTFEVEGGDQDRRLGLIKQGCPHHRRRGGRFSAFILPKLGIDHLTLPLADLRRPAQAGDEFHLERGAGQLPPSCTLMSSWGIFIKGLSLDRSRCGLLS